MKNFNRDTRPERRSGPKKFGNRSFGGRSFGGSRDDRRPSLHKATCHDCGKECAVPFKPTGDKPVFCSDCFKNKDRGDSRRSGGRDFSRPSFGDKQMHTATCAKCGKKCEVPFRPTEGKPVYCSQCFENGGPTSKNPEQFQKQFEILNNKLDRILKTLNPVTVKEVVPSKMAVKKIKISSVKKVAKKTTKKKKK
jgi:CxxC-x17-CxxC domain-containing protein